MRLFFLPADAPIWLRLVVYSIRDGLSDVWNTAIRLKDYTTAGLPPAADWKQGIVYDSTTNSLKMSNGTAWVAAGVSDGDKGDITVSGSGATWTIDNDAVTYAKMQNVSATDKVLGRSTAGAGDVEEIACTAAGRALIDDADAAAQRTTLGLGTAAVKNTGVSGDAVPVLNGAATTWAAGATFAGNLTVGTGADTGTSRSVTKWNQGGWGNPVAPGSTSNGDKIVLYEGGTYRVIIGMDANADIWSQANANHQWFLGATPTEYMNLSAAGLAVTGNVSASTRFDLPSYTVAGLPAVGVAGGMIYVSNEVGGAVPAFSDGTNWRRVTDRAIVA